MLMPDKVIRCRFDLDHEVSPNGFCDVRWFRTDDRGKLIEITRERFQLRNHAICRRTRSVSRTNRKSAFKARGVSWRAGLHRVTSNTGAKYPTFKEREARAAGLSNHGSRWAMAVPKTLPMLAGLTGGRTGCIRPGRHRRARHLEPRSCNLSPPRHDAARRSSDRYPRGRENCRLHRQPGGPDSRNRGSQARRFTAHSTMPGCD